MDAATAPLSTVVSPPAWKRWVGWALTGLPAAAMVASAGMKFIHPPDMVAMFTGKFGYQATVLPVLGGLELLCVILFLVSRTAVLGAVLMTGYLGGAVATHVRVADAFVAPLLLGIMAWGGLFFRDERVRNLLPLRK